MTSRAAPVTVHIRDARPQDMARLQAIYADHVLRGLASFEETPPDAAEMLRRYETALQQGFPYLVAELDGLGAGRGPVGYAYAGRYRTRPAYRFSVENSVYVDSECLGQGVGRALLAELIRRCDGLGYRQMIAVIGDSGNAASIRLHEALGFIYVGNLRSVGFKFGRWIDSVIMQRPLGGGDGTIPTAPPAGWPI